MSDYTQITDFSAKDSLTSGDPEKIVLGSDVDAELDAISTAIGTKYDVTDLASQAQAEAGALNTVLMTPLRVNDAMVHYNDNTGAGMLGDIGALTDTNADKILFWDDSAGAVAQLAPDGTELVITGTNFAISSLAASKLTGSHTLPDGVLSTNVPLLNTANTFVSSVAGGFSMIQENTSNNSAAYAQSIVYNGTNYLSMLIPGTGATLSGLGFTSVPNAMYAFLYTPGSTGLAIGTNSTGRLVIDTSGNFDFKGGTVTTNNASASEVGYKGIPQNTQTGNYTLVLADANKEIFRSSGSSGITWTIPANGSVAFPIGTTIVFTNFPGSGNTASIAITTDTLFLAGSGSTGTRTLADNGVAVARKITSTAWVISGVGLS